MQNTHKQEQKVVKTHPSEHPHTAILAIDVAKTRKVRKIIQKLLIQKLESKHRALLLGHLSALNEILHLALQPRPKDVQLHPRVQQVEVFGGIFVDCFLVFDVDVDELHPELFYQFLEDLEVELVEGVVGLEDVDARGLVDADFVG